MNVKLDSLTRTCSGVICTVLLTSCATTPRQSGSPETTSSVEARELLREFDKLEIQAEAPARGPSSEISAATLTKPSTGLKEIYQLFTAAKTSKDIETNLSYLDKHYDELNTDTKYVSVQLINLGCLRGITARMELFLTDSFGKEKLEVQSQQYLTDLNHNLALKYKPGVWPALDLYVSSFSEHENNGKKFSHFSDLQHFLGQVCFPLLMKGAARLKKIEVGPSFATWDPDSLGVSSAEVPMKFITPDVKSLALARIFDSLSWIATLVSYDMADYYSSKGQIQIYAPEMLLSHINKSQTKRLTAFETLNIMRRPPRFLTLLPTGTEDWTKIVSKCFTHALHFTIQGLNERQTRLTEAWKNGARQASRPKTDFSDLVTRLQALSGGPAVLNDGTYNVRIDLVNFLHNPPKDLRQLLATEFDVNTGSSKGWQVRSFLPLFPDVRNSDDVRIATQVLNATLKDAHMRFPLIHFANRWMPKQ